VADKAALDARRPPRRADLDLFMRSLLHAVKVMGVDHVGIGADWDGGRRPGRHEGHWRLACDHRAAARSRLQRGDIQKIWAGNTLRLLRAAERAAARP
jgi:membrane dipeptidase